MLCCRAWRVLLLQCMNGPLHLLLAAHADLTELQLPSNININFPEGKEKPMHFEISIKPDEGYYRCAASQYTARLALCISQNG